MIPGFLKGRLRGQARRFMLNETCLIEQNVPTYADSGAVTETWVSVASNVPCRVIRVGGVGQSAGVIAQQETLKDVYRVVVPAKDATTYTWDLKADQRITVDGAAYSVIGIEDALTDDLYRQAIVAKERIGS
jgi:hypothetical protein